LAATQTMFRALRTARGGRRLVLLAEGDTDQSIAIAAARFSEIFHRSRNLLQERVRHALILAVGERDGCDMVLIDRVGRLIHCSQRF